MSITVQHITKSFGRFTALSDVNLHVPTGELVALLGPSGSGKTTLLRIIAGLEIADPSSGPILFHEEDVARRSVGERGVGFVFQHYALFRHMTILENVAFGLRVRPRRQRPKRQAIKEKVFGLLDLMQLTGLAHRYPSELSGGQRQRVALARCLAVEPKVLLLDEPFGALDAKVRLELRRWLRRLHDELHITSVFVTHDQDEALEVADRVVVMNKGSVEHVGSPDDVFHRPATEFVMQFLGNSNVFHGRLEAGRIAFGPLAVTYAQTPETRDGDARVFIRPHEFDIASHKNGRPSFRARVVRINAAGPQVKLELLSEFGQSFDVELPQEKFQALAIATSSDVFVSPNRVQVFSGTQEILPGKLQAADDYSI